MVVNTRFDNDQFQSALKVLTDNELLVTWTDRNQVSGSTFDGIAGQLFKLSSVPVPAVPVHNDIDGDAQSDVIFNNSGGATVVWEMNGTQVKLASGIGTTMPGYDVAGTGDFDPGDLKSDLLFRDHSSGYVVMWEMNGANVKLAAGVGTPLPSGFNIAGTGDFDGDGHSGHSDA